jgi:hypothetical protein
MNSRKSVSGRQRLLQMSWFNTLENGGCAGSVQLFTKPDGRVQTLIETLLIISRLKIIQFRATHVLEKI